MVRRLAAGLRRGQDKLCADYINYVRFIYTPMIMVHKLWISTMLAIFRVVVFYIFMAG